MRIERHVGTIQIPVCSTQKYRFGCKGRDVSFEVRKSQRRADRRTDKKEWLTGMPPTLVVIPTLPNEDHTEVGLLSY
jgi:hypothetical protein